MRMRSGWARARIAAASSCLTVSAVGCPFVMQRIFAKSLCKSNPRPPATVRRCIESSCGGRATWVGRRSGRWRGTGTWSWSGWSWPTPTRSAATPASWPSSTRSAWSRPTTPARALADDVDAVVYTATADTRPDDALADLLACLEAGKDVVSTSFYPLLHPTVRPAGAARRRRGGLRHGRRVGVRVRHRPGLGARHPPRPGQRRRRRHHRDPGPGGLQLRPLRPARRGARGHRLRRPDGRDCR